MALTTVAAGTLLPSDLLFAQAAPKPNSVFAGVTIGINAPISFRGLGVSTADQIIAGMTRVGLSACELRLQPVEGYIRGTGGSPIPTTTPGGAPGGMPGGAPGGMPGGAPGAAPGGAARAGAPGGAPGGAPPAGGAMPQRAPLTPEQIAAQKAQAEDLRKWRLGLSMDVFKAFRKKFEDAGILIPVLKVDAINTFTDDEIDYSFTVAKLLGARGLSTEIPLDDAKRIGTFADKHQILVGYHGHTNTADPQAFATPQSWETAMTFAKYNGCNHDLGHFLAANNISPADFLRKHHDRITHLHLKDRKKNLGPNMPWGEGDTPIVECLRMIRDNKWNIMAAIEMEHPTPAGSDNWIQLGKCLDYAKQALLT